MSGVELHEQAHALAMAGRWQEAIEVATRALTEIRAELGDDPQLATVLTNLGSYHAEVEQWDQALAYYSEGLERRRRAFGDRHPNVAKTLYHVGRCRAALGRPAEAAAAFRDSAAIFDEHPDAAPQLHVRALLGLAAAVRELGRRDEAVAALLAGVRRAAAYTVRDPRFGGDLQDLLMACVVEGELAALIDAAMAGAGYPAGAQLLDDFASGILQRRRRAAPGEPVFAILDRVSAAVQSQDVAQACRLLAEAYETLPPSDVLRPFVDVKRRVFDLVAARIAPAAGLRPEHEAVFQQILAAPDDVANLPRAEQLLAEARPYLPDSAIEKPALMGAVARLRAAAGASDQGLALFEEALAIARTQSAMSAAFIAGGLAHTLHALGRFAEANPHYQAYAAMLVEEAGAANPRTLKAQSDWAQNLMHLGRLADAEQLLRAIWNVVADTPSDVMAAVALSLAVLCKDTARYEEADTFYTQAIERTRSVFGEKSRAHALALNNYAVYQRELGRDDKARDLLGRAREIAETIDNARAELARILAEQAGLISDTRVAEVQLIQARDLAIAALGKGHELVVSILEKLGDVQVQRRETDAAVTTFETCLQLREATFGTEHPSCAMTLLWLGELYDRLGRTGDAEQALVRALGIRRRALGDRHPRTATALTLLANFSWRHGNSARALDALAEAIEIRVHVLRELFPGMTDDARARYWDELRDAFELAALFAFADSPDHARAVALLYDVELFRKDLLVESTARMRRTSGAAATPAYAAWIAAKRALASRMLRGESGTAELAATVDAAEQQLAKTARAAAEPQRLTWRDVRARLAATDAAVEIVRVGRAEKPAYAALVLRGDRDAPERVVLGDAATLEGPALDTYLTCRETVSPRPFEQYWAPLAAALQGIARVFVSADGVYCRLDLNALYDASKKRFLLDVIDIRHVSSTRALAEPAAERPADRTAVLLGRPAYDQALAGESADARLPMVPPEVLAAMRFTDLAGSEQEVTDLGTLLRDRGWTVQTLLGAAASKAALQQVTRPRVLHIATHAYFRDIQDIAFQHHDGRALRLIEPTGGDPRPGRAQLLAELAREGYERDDVRVAERSTELTRTLDPLFRSGLALAGVSARGELPQLDGLLSAYEAAALDLAATELVVLSACDSGRGALRAGESAIGLVRAFRGAGAASVLATLWPVDDHVARELVAAFYAQWLEHGDARAALRVAQQTLKKKYRLPIFWAGFVVVGR